MVVVFIALYSDDAAAVPVLILRDLLTAGEQMMGLWQSTVPCGEMLEGEMCWTLQAGDDVLEDTSEPQLGRSIARDLMGSSFVKCHRGRSWGTRRRS
jgi:hypothetical protein